MAREAPREAYQMYEMSYRAGGGDIWYKTGYSRYLMCKMFTGLLVHMSSIQDQISMESYAQDKVEG